MSSDEHIFIYCGENEGKSYKVKILHGTNIKWVNLLMKLTTTVETRKK